MLVLFLGYNVGLSDQSDFSRVMNVSSLAHCVHDRAFIFVDRYTIVLHETSLLSNIVRILFTTENFADYPSIHVVVVRVSVVVNLFINAVTGSDLTVYRLGILGAATALVYAGLLFWLFRQIKLKNKILDVTAKLVIIVVACDIGYISYFNSFYSESMQILAFLMVVVTVLRIFIGKTRLPDYVLVVFAAVFYGWSKFANLPVAVLLIVCAGAIFIFIIKKTRAVLYITLIAVLGITPLILVYNNVPKWMAVDTNFNSVFFGIIKDTDEATSRLYLEALGLDPDMVHFASQNRYVAGVIEEFNRMGFEQEFARLSKLDLLWFYIQRPTLLAEGLTMRIAHSGQIRPWYLANYGFARMEQSNRFSAWSVMRSNMGFDTVYGNIVLWVAFIVVLVAQLWHHVKIRKVILFLLFAVLGSAVYSLVVQMVANGEADIAKQMFMYVQMVDFTFIFVFLVGLSAVLKVKKTVSRVCLNTRIRLVTRICLATRICSVPRICLVTAVICVAVLFVPMTVSAIRGFTPPRIKEIQYASTGDTVSFGTFRGKELFWTVVDEYENTLVLMAAENITNKPFDTNGSNLWVNASIREWLNNEFLTEAFDDGLQILKQQRYVLLTRETKEHATFGDREFYIYHVPVYAFRGVDRAYRMVVEDYVRLPCADIMNRLVADGQPVRGGYWLEIPRYNDGFLVRYVSNDGFVPLRLATNISGVRPIIKIER
jgi:hypothetical protein